ncbi:ferredoxin, partial [Thioclava sp. BHET1]
QDGSALPPFRAGQHLPVFLDIPGHAGTIQRSYSLSGPQEAPFYRISVKREAGGLASRHLHDRIGEGDLILAAPPAGDFILPAGDGPLVLVSAGVGVTPIMAMLHSAAQDGREVWFVHGVRNGAARPFGAELAAITGGAESIRQRIYYSQPTAADGPATMSARHGRIDLQELIHLSPDPRTHYMICGSETFVAAVVAGLEEAGIAASRLRFESFGASG